MAKMDGQWRSIPDMVRQAAAEFGSSIAVIDEGINWSFYDVEKAMFDAAKGFLALGVRPGDRVALCGPNSARWIQAALGIQAVGGVLVPINTRFKGDEITHVLRQSDASALVTVGRFLGNDYVTMVRDSDSSVRAADQIIILDDEGIAGTHTFTELMDNGSRQFTTDDATERLQSVGLTDLADVMFTSGTSGAPKGVMLTHGQSLRAYTTMGEAFTFRHGDVILVIPPFFHAYGYKAGWMAAFIFGLTVIPQRSFATEQILERIEKYRVSVMLGPPTIFVDIMNHPRLADYDISSLRVSNVSAARIPEQLIGELRTVLGFDVVLSAYGLTEATAVVSLSTADDDARHVSTTAGRAARDVEVKTVDENGNETRPGAPGEIWVRGYNVMRGYWRDEEATRAAITSDGWLKTGDIGVLDQDGYLSITDRMKDMFIVGGFNAYPAEIEAALVRHDRIQDVAVVGAPDARMGEVGIAFVVPVPGSGLSEAEVTEYAREHLANFKVPRRVVVVDGLPRNASMKVVKGVLRENAKQLVSDAES